MDPKHQMITAAEQVARRRSGSFRHWSGRTRCAVCGRALARDERVLRVHSVPLHARCAGFRVASYDA